MNDVSVVIQTCDKYNKFWDGFFYYFEKFWDKNIKAEIFFCNDYKKIKTPNNIRCITTNKDNFVDGLRCILSQIKTEYVFYILEDFWFFDKMPAQIFGGLFNFILEKNIFVLQVSPILPYYNLNYNSNYYFHNQKILKFEENSDWIFNFQTRFWKCELLEKCLIDPKISEKQVGSAISVEFECDQYVKTNRILKDVYLYHYLYYPIGGVAYRGNFTKLGQEMQNNMMIDLHGKNLIKNNI
jgi:hypothetical protein